MLGLLFGDRRVSNAVGERSQGSVTDCSARGTAAEGTRKEFGDSE